MHNTDPDKNIRSSNSNRYVDGFTIRHYATPIACKYPDKKGPNGVGGTVVFNNRTYSSRTSKFQSHIRRAIPATWHVVFVESTRFQFGRDYVSKPRYVKQALEIMYEDIEKFVKDLKAAKLKSTRANLWGKITRKQRDVIAVAKFLGIKPRSLARFKLDVDTIAREAQEYEDLMKTRRELRWEKDRAENERQKALRDAELKMTRDERVAKWRANESSSYMHMGGEGVLLRFSKDGRRVQTSMHVEITLRDALNLFRLAKAVHEGDPADPAVAAFAARVTNERKSVGAYTLDHLYCNGDVKVGCHFLKYEEMEQLFNQLTDEQKKGFNDADVQS
jgi:hypothetical protein